MTSLQKLRSKIASDGIDAILVSDIVNLNWLSAFTGSSGVAVITKDQARFITDSRYTIQANEEVQDLDVYTFSSPVLLVDFVISNAKEMGISSLGVEAQQMSYSTFQSWKEKFADISLVPLTDPISPLRMIKTAEEIQGIEECCRVADQGFEHISRLFQPGVSEEDIALELEFFFRRQGGRIAFDTIVASGWRGALPHGRASDKLIESGDLVTIDFGFCKDGLNSDITRTFAVGEPDARQIEVYNQVLKAQLGALEAMKPGVPCREVDARSREILDEIGLAKYFGHGLGHGLGRLVHDHGRLGPSSTEVLEVGQVWTVEPGVYLEGWGGVRIEDDVVVTEDGIKILNETSKDLLVFPRT